MLFMSDIDNSTFCNLIRVVIGKESCLFFTPTGDDWGKLYSIAKKQSLVGVCFDGIQRLQKQMQTPPEMVYLKWMGMAAKIQQRNEMLNRQCIDLQKMLSADGLRSCILKGQGVALLYGEKLCGLRQPGDIDIWVDAPKEKVIEYVMKSAPTKDFDQKHIHYHCFDNTDVEAHWVPVKHYNPIWDRILEEYFENERGRQFSNIHDGLCVPTADFQLVHQLLHVYGHYVYEGVGMRQMMDLYFAQVAVRNNDDYLRVLTLFEKLGLMRFVAATQWVLGEVFQMPRNKMLCDPNEKEGRKLLDEIMIGGNFGHHDTRNHVEGESFLGRFFRRWGRKFRMFRFDPLGTIIMPFARLKLELWMRRVRKQYGM